MRKGMFSSCLPTKHMRGTCTSWTCMYNLDPYHSRECCRAQCCRPLQNTKVHFLRCWGSDSSCLLTRYFLPETHILVWTPRPARLGPSIRHTSAQPRSRRCRPCTRYLSVSLCSSALQSERYNVGLVPLQGRTYEFFGGFWAGFIKGG